MDSGVQGQDTRLEKTKDGNNKDCEEKQPYDYPKPCKETKNIKK